MIFLISKYLFFSCTDGTKQTHHGVHKILSVFGKKSDFPTSPKLGDQKRKESNEAALMPTATSNDVVKEGLLDVLVSSTDGKVKIGFLVQCL